MAKRIFKPFFCVFVLSAVLGIGILIGNNWPNKSPINPPIANSQENKTQQTASVGSAAKNNIGSEDKDNKSNGSDAKSLTVNSTRSVKVIRVLDGDTIEIEGGERVRYLGVNAPESGQSFSTEATRENERLVAGRVVNLEFDVQTQDRYGRSLAHIWVGNTLVNKEIVKNGHAVSETIPPNAKYQDLMLAAQQEARDACRGLWAGLCSPNGGDSSCLKIVNINADAPGNDNENKNGEWIEIKNICSQAISMNNWLLKDSSANNKYEFGNFTLDGAKSAIIYSGCGVDAPGKLFWRCPEGKYAVWNNAGDHAFLYDAAGNLAAEYQY